MSFRGDDDYEYLDDEDFYYEEDDEDDEDEELGGGWRDKLGSDRSSGLPGRDRSTNVLGSSGSTPTGRSNVSDTSSLPGRGTFGSRSSFSPGGTSRDPLRDRGSRPATTSPGGSSSPSGTTDWRARINTDKTPSSPTPSSSSSDWRTRAKPNETSPSSSSSFGKTPSSGSGSGSLNTNWRDKLGSSSPTDKKDSSPVPPASRADRLDALSKSGKTDDKKPDDKKDDSGGGFSISNPFSKSDDKKPDNKKDDSGGGRFNRFGLGSNKDDDKKADDKKPDNKKDDSGGGRFNRFGLGSNKDDDKKADAKKPVDQKESSKNSLRGGIGGVRNRSIGGANDKKEAPKTSVKPDDKKGNDGGNPVAAVVGGIGGTFSGFRKRLTSSEDDTKDKDAKTASKFSNTSPKSSDTGGRTSTFGRGASTSTDDKKADAKKSADKKATAKDATAEDSGGGLFGNVISRLRGGDDSDAKDTKAAPKARASKAPKVESDDWFDLDRKLDLVGVGLVFGSILLFFSALSQEQAAISFVHNLIGQLFGWGAISVPITMFAVGMWLIIRHFGDDAPTVDPVRLGGVVIGFIGVLILFQYFESFNYIELIPEAQEARILECSAEFEDSCTQDIRNLAECDVSITQGCLEGLVKYSYERADGGGIVGGWLYLTLVNNVTEIGGFVLVAMVLTFALMMITHLSMAEIAVVVIGVGRSLRTSMAQNAARRRAQRLREQQQKALTAEATSVSVSKPAPAQLPGFAQMNALPEPSDDAGGAIPIEERDILIRRGGQAFSTTELNQESVLLGANPQLQPQNENSSGFFGRFFGRNKSEPQQPIQPQQPNPGTAAVAAAAGAGLVGRFLNRSGDAPTQPQTQTNPPLQPTQANNMPIGGTNPSVPMQPAPQQQPAQMPQQPVQQPQTQPPQVTQPAPQQPPAQIPQQPVQQPQTQPQSHGDAIMQRQDRLNAIRSGMTAPQQPQTQTQPSQPVSQNGGMGSNDYNPFGRPDDLPTHESEKLPGQAYSSTSVTSTQSQPSPQVNPQNNNVQKPVSSGPVNQSRPRINWKVPDFRTLLSSGSEQEFDRENLLNQARVIEETLASFGAPGRVVEVNTGPVITQFGVEPDYLTARSGKKSRVKVSAIAQLDKDLQLALGAKSIRVEAPVPGKGYVGIEVPNTEASLVSLRDVMESEGFQKIKSPLAIALGMAVDGTPISADLTAMPHLLIAGTTGSGKSVCVNAIINSVIATNSPEDVKFIMVDPKRVELTGYNGLPHLIAPVVVELERIVGVLKWVTREMDERYKKFSNIGARNIIDYNKHRDDNLEPMPYIVVIIDELADLMMLAPEETERTITRIAALARATGIHLVIATQRPSVDVVTGLIKANFPARIAFAVAGGVDSRVILDQPGAERLLGKGDMLYLSGDSPAPLRLQGVYVSDLEISNISRYWKMQSVGVETVKPISVLTKAVEEDEANAPAPIGDRIKQAAFWDASTNTSEPDDPQQLAIEDQTGNPDPQEDELYDTAVQMVRRLDKASISLLQRRLRIGYTRAARLVDMMEERGVVGPAKEGSSKPRDVIPE